MSNCLSDCLSISNKRQHCCADKAQTFCGNSLDPREGLWIIKFARKKMFTFINFLEIRQFKSLEQFKMANFRATNKS